MKQMHAGPQSSLKSVETDTVHFIFESQEQGLFVTIAPVVKHIINLLPLFFEKITQRANCSSMLLCLIK